MTECDFTTHNETSVRCSKCGRIIKTPFADQPEKVRAKCKSTNEKTPMKSRGLGDTIAKITTATGVKKIVDKVSRLTNTPCGCEERQKRLNELFPY